MKGLIFVKKLISGLLALTIAASTTAVVSSAAAPKWGTIDVGTDNITLRWTKDNAADGYRVYRYDVADGKYVTVKTVNGRKTFCKISGLKAGTAYKYVVKAYYYDKAGVGTSHTKLGKKSKAAVVSTKPTSTSITKKTRSSAKAVRVFWNKYAFTNKVDKQSNYKFGGYHISRYNGANDDWVLEACVSGGRTNVRVSGLKKNTKYTWKVTPFTVSVVNGSAYETEGDASKEYTIKTKNYWCNC
jgi:hypothetical protein